MTALSSPEGHGRPEQHNHSSGTFVGRDLYKIETLDPKTKAVLEQLSRDTPGLAKIVSKALRDGVIPPDAVQALASAARNINEDVASALWHASQSINEDVANSLHFAAEKINPDVAHNITAASSQLAEATGDLERVLAGFHRATGVISSANANARDWESVAEAMDEAAQNMAFAAQARDATRRGWSWNSFWCGAGVCFAALIVFLTLWDFALKK